MKIKYVMAVGRDEFDTPELFKFEVDTDNHEVEYDTDKKILEVMDTKCDENADHVVLWQHNVVSLHAVDLFPITHGAK